jgi:hypothetical protein
MNKNNTVKIFFILGLVFSMADVSAQSSAVIERHQDAGMCFGAYEGALAKGGKAENLSEVARSNLTKIFKEFSKMDKWKNERKNCHSAGGSVDDVRECIDKKISNKSAASFWKGYVSGIEFAFAKPTQEAEYTAQTLCVTFK